MAALNEYGTKGALEFCNTRAIPLTDSMAQHFEARIRRVSDQPRNPDNRANENEVSIIRGYKDQLKDGMTTEPILEEDAEYYTFYAPITTNQMCLQCHGTVGEHIVPEVTDALATLYPDDEATGYSENQVRGIWRIVFERE